MRGDCGKAVRDQRGYERVHVKRSMKEMGKRKKAEGENFAMFSLAVCTEPENSGSWEESHRQGGVFGGRTTVHRETSHRTWEWSQWRGRGRGIGDGF